MAEDSFRFLDLPPEIRNEIYALLLPEEKQIYIYRYLRSRRTIFRAGSNINVAGLLRTNRQIHQEVAPILYGTITFLLNIDEHIARWLRSIGSMKQHMRYVYLLGYTKSSVRSGLNQLKQARFLKSIILESEFRQWLYYKGTSQVAEALRPFIHTIKKQQARNGTDDDIVDSIRLHPRSTYGAIGETPAQTTKLDEEFAAALRAELKSLLE